MDYRYINRKVELQKILNQLRNADDSIELSSSTFVSPWQVVKDLTELGLEKRESMCGRTVCTLHSPERHRVYQLRWNGFTFKMYLDLLWDVDEEVDE